MFIHMLAISLNQNGENILHITIPCGRGPELPTSTRYFNNLICLYIPFQAFVDAAWIHVNHIANQYRRECSCGIRFVSVNHVAAVFKRLFSQIDSSDPFVCLTLHVTLVEEFKNIEHLALFIHNNTVDRQTRSFRIRNPFIPAVRTYIVSQNSSEFYIVIIMWTMLNTE